MHYAPAADTLGRAAGDLPVPGQLPAGRGDRPRRRRPGVHGHAHAGTERGTTAGARVRNVAQPVIGRAYNVYCLDWPPVVAAQAGEVAGTWPGRPEAAGAP